MPPPSLSQLLGDKTKEDFFNDLAAACEAEGLSPEAWAEGQPMRKVMGLISRVLAVLWSVVARPALRAAFLDHSSGAFLALYAFSTYGVRRKGKEAAIRPLVMENTSSNFFALVPGQIRIKNSVTGKTFTNTTGGPLLAWPGGAAAKPTVTLTFIADEAGTASNTAADDLELVPITGPTGVRVKTAGAFLGSDEESDDAIKVRCKCSMGTLSAAGPKAAYQFAGLSTYRPDGSPVAVNRVRVVDVGRCTVEVWLASASGPTTGDMATAGTDVYFVYRNILDTVKPIGFTANVYGAGTVAKTIAVALVVDAGSGLTEEAAKDAAKVAIADYLKRVPIGGWHTAPLITATDPGKILVNEMLAKATESAPGILRATATISGGGSDVSIAYNAIPDVLVSVTATLVEQSATS